MNEGKSGFTCLQIAVLLRQRPRHLSSSLEYAAIGRPPRQPIVK
jgi:hypothetical protein